MQSSEKSVVLTMEGVEARVVVGCDDYRRVGNGGWLGWRLEVRKSKKSHRDETVEGQNPHVRCELLARAFQGRREQKCGGGSV